METVRMKVVGIVALVGLLVGGAIADAGDLPWKKKWWPSKWGADDERGAFNTLTPQKVLAAMKLVKTGRIYRMGRPYTLDMPIAWGRSYSISIPGLPTGGPYGKNEIVWNDEIIFGDLGQIGTQFDGPGHVGIKGKDGVERWYNGRALAQDNQNARGLKVNGVETLGPCVTRGVLIDVAGLRGVKQMQAGEVITAADIEACIQKAGIDPIGEGDAVIFHTGWGNFWNQPETYNAGEPGIGLEAARYLIDKNVSMVGADNWSVEVVPGEDPELVFEVHCLMQPVHGIWFIENLSNEPMQAMIKDGIYEFLWVFVPVPFAGATGSPGDALAIR